MPFATVLGHCPWSEGVIPEHLLLPKASLHGPGSQEPLLSGYSPHEESHHVCSHHRQNGVTKLIPAATIEPMESWDTLHSRGNFLDLGTERTWNGIEGALRLMAVPESQVLPCGLAARA